jgi:hypothetical protein
MKPEHSCHVPPRASQFVELTGVWRRGSAIARSVAETFRTFDTGAALMNWQRIRIGIASSSNAAIVALETPAKASDAHIQTGIGQCR